MDDHSEFRLEVILGWLWPEVAQFLLISLFILIAVSVKIFYETYRRLFFNFPESCVLILLGVLGALIFVLNDWEDHLPIFTPQLFNFILLPPIVLESSYELDDHFFFSNIGTVVTFAVVGTLLNIVLVTGAIYFTLTTGLMNLEIDSVELFTFSIIVAAVDPVAVLSVFQEVNVNKALYFLVFGESLLNDAVVITAFESILQFAKLPIIRAINTILAFLSFCASTVFGLAIGTIFGLLTALLIQTTRKQKLKVVEPLIMIILAYISYLTASLLRTSAILSITACGLMQSRFARPNLSSRSALNVRYFTSISSSVAETIIFLFLGIVLVETDYYWSQSFVVFSTFYIIVARFVTVFALTYAANNFFQRIRIVNLEEQILIAYGGLRGAIAFSLATILRHPEPSLNRPLVKAHKLFTTTTLFIILFTVLVLGTTTKPVVKMLRVQIQTQSGRRTFLELNRKVAHKVMQGIEIISGQRLTMIWAQKIELLHNILLRKIVLGSENQISSWGPSMELREAQKSTQIAARFEIQKLETPEKDEYPDLNRRIRLEEAFDADGNLIFDRSLPDNMVFSPQVEEWKVLIHDVYREFVIPKECLSLLRVKDSQDGSSSHETADPPPN